MAETVKTIAEMLQEPDEKIEETPVVETTPEKSEEKPVEPVVEETPKEEPVVETIKEETPKEETPKEETPKEEEPEEQPEKTYAGKFKTLEDLEKAYNNLEKAYSKKSMAVSEKVKETESLVDEREFQNKINEVIEDKGLKLIKKSFASITDEESRKKAAEYLMGYESTGDSRYIDQYYNCLPPSIDRQLQQQLTQVVLETRQDFASRRNEIIYEPVKNELQEIEAEDPEFLKENQDILVQAIRNNPKTSVKEIRDLIKEVEKKAVEKYQKSLKSTPKVEKSAVIPASKASAPSPEDTPKKPERLMTVKEMLLNG